MINSQWENCGMPHGVDVIRSKCSGRWRIPIEVGGWGHLEEHHGGGLGDPHREAWIVPLRKGGSPALLGVTQTCSSVYFGKVSLAGFWRIVNKRQGDLNSWAPVSAVERSRGLDQKLALLCGPHQSSGCPWLAPYSSPPWLLFCSFFLIVFKGWIIFISFALMKSSNCTPELWEKFSIL